MIISVRQTGGFAGDLDLVTVDTQRLEAERSRQVEELVEKLDFFSLQEVIPGTEVGADIARYEITIIDEEQQHTVAFDIDGNPETMQLRQLVDTLIQGG